MSLISSAKPQEPNQISCTRQMIKRGKICLEVEMQGEEGPLICFLPTLGRSLEDYALLAKILSSKGFKTLAINPRGVGASQGPLDNLTLMDFATDVAWVIDDLSETPAHVMGHGLGNRVARCLATSYPEQVQSLILLAAGGQIQPVPEIINLVRQFMALLSAGEGSDAEILDIAQTIYFSKTAIIPANWLQGWCLGALQAQRAANRATSVSTWWSGGEAPILVIQGLEDQIAPPANGHALYQDLEGRNIQVVDLEHAGHMLLLEQPEEIAATTEQFLRNFSR